MSGAAGRTRVVVDLVYLTGRKGGTETYARGLFRELADVAPQLELVGITNTEVGATAPDWFPGPVHRLPVSGEDRLAWAATEAVAVGPLARRLGGDLLHCPSNFGPAVRWLPTVVTVHDLLANKHREWAPGLLGRGVAVLARRSARAATRVLTDSQASADDLVRLVGLPQGRIDVVPLATSTAAASGSAPAPARPFVLSTGNRMRHKNFDGLLQAWSRIPADRRPLLVLTGSHGDDPLRPLVQRLGLDDDVELREWVPEDELERLYATASAYVCPSLFEGFGLPVLEAMRRGCPVVSSDIPVLREVGGDAVRWVDARSADALAAAVLGVVADPGEQRRLREAGLRRAELFTWRRTAELTAASYERALSSAGRR